MHGTCAPRVPRGGRRRRAGTAMNWAAAASDRVLPRGGGRNRHDAAAGHRTAAGEGPLDALPEPQNLGRFKKVITGRWGTVPRHADLDPRNDLIAAGPNETPGERTSGP